MTATLLRVHRAAAAVWAALILALTVWEVWLNQVTADDTRAAQTHCTQDYCDVFSSPYADWTGVVALVTGYAFLAVAAFAGGALIGRELESGTARLAWTQGITPTRWLAAKLALPALALTLGLGAVVAVFHWGWAVNRDLMWDDWYAQAFYLAGGPTAVAYALCALAVGTLTALLLRRTLPALGASVAVMWLLGLVLETYRADLWPRRTRTSAKPVELPEHVWEVASGRNAGGYYAVFHPESHYWPLQLVECGIVLALAGAAVAVSFTVLRRRAA
ncbi:hypothetical protein ACF1AX_35525 [Streptomyces sp. NPDC014802]|jgi:hypothetical protein|uniref:hypothetical protein n=1 Tax=Streptomyces sp. NPDC014802 TaxID=3364917 RepID=UPI003700DCC0